jgi:DNA-binding MarR family transcriptional regulator
MRRPQILEMATAIGRDLGAIRHILKQPLEAEIAKGALTGPQQSAMSALVLADGMSLKDLSRDLGLAHSTASGIVDRLEKQGLVERQPDPADGRITRIVPTDQVREFVAKTMPALELHPLAQALLGATPAERRQVSEGLRVLRELLERRQS